MGAGGIMSGGVYKVVEARKLPTIGAKPNSRYDLYVNGKRKQSRWFDSNGTVVRNRDYFHEDNGTHSFPHDHPWEIVGVFIDKNGIAHLDGERMEPGISPDFDEYPS